MQQIRSSKKNASGANVWLSEKGWKKKFEVVMYTAKNRRVKK